MTKSLYIVAITGIFLCGGCESTRSQSDDQTDNTPTDIAMDESATDADDSDGTDNGVQNGIDDEVGVL